MIGLRRRYDSWDVFAVVMTLADWMQRDEVFAVNLQQRLIDCLETCTVPEYADHYAGIIRETATRRAVIDAALATIAEAMQ